MTTHTGTPPRVTARDVRAVLDLAAHQQGRTAAARPVSWSDALARVRRTLAAGPSGRRHTG